MANPITKIKKIEIPDDVVHEQNLEEVARAVSENKDAILKGIDFLSTINDNGMLDMTHSLVKQKETALDNVMRELNKPQYSATLENVSSLFLLIGELNVEELKHFTGKLNDGLEKSRTFDESEKTSYLDLIKALKDPEINRSVTMLLQFLRGMGKE
ncbi:DUF1641 domain-containing protein [Virgibacillus necropolis]|uniref:DUF1641 domain-containing protein n=1 Tax=Virgibacillus necropolis TaxID=163877 RepID=A0A221MEA9_9BACI|nr:DUF1641 domain-containing protein [Virgibacillus necropolis]ASN05952.1 hypothetical protein CFK40_13470 [Virgibacillus necropolis]